MSGYLLMKIGFSIIFLCLILLFIVGKSIIINANYTTIQKERRYYDHIIYCFNNANITNSNHIYN